MQPLCCNPKTSSICAVRSARTCKIVNGTYVRVLTTREKKGEAAKRMNEGRLRKEDELRLGEEKEENRSTGWLGGDDGVR